MPTMTLGAVARPSQVRPRQKQPQKQRAPGRQGQGGGRTTTVGERQQQSEDGERRPSRSSRTESRKSPSQSSSSNGRSRSSSRTSSKSQRGRRSKSRRKSPKDTNDPSTSSRSLSSMDEDSALKVVFAYLNEEDAPGPNSWRKHGHSKRERLLSGEPSTTSTTTAASHHVPIHRYYAMADKVLSAFTGAFHTTPEGSSDMHRLDDAFVYGHRLLILLLKTLPTHPMYKSELSEYKALRKTSLSNVRFVHRNMKDIVEQMDKKEFNIVRYKDMERRMSNGTASDTTNGGVVADAREAELKALSNRNGAMNVDDNGAQVGSASSSPAFEVVSSPWREKLQSAQQVDDSDVRANPAPVTPVRRDTKGDPPGTPRRQNVADSNSQWETLLTPVQDDDEETMCTFKSDAATYRRNVVPRKVEMGGQKGTSDTSSAAATPDGQRRRTTQTTKLSSTQKNKDDKASHENSFWNSPSFSVDGDESRSNPQGSAIVKTSSRGVAEDDGGDAWNLAVTSTFSFDSEQKAINKSQAKRSVDMPEKKGAADAYGWNVADASTFSFDDEELTTGFDQSSSTFGTPQRSKENGYGWSDAMASSFSFDTEQSSIDDDSRSSIGGDVDLSSASNLNNEVHQVFGDFAEGEDSSTWPTPVAQRTMSNLFTDDDFIPDSTMESPSGLHDEEIALVLAVDDSRDQDERDDADYLNRRTPTPTSLIDPPHLERFANDCVENLHWIDHSQEESMEPEEQETKKFVAMKSGLTLVDPNYDSKEQQRWKKPQKLATERGYAGSDDNFARDRTTERIVTANKVTMDNNATTSETAAWRSSRQEPSAPRASFAASPSNSRAPSRDLSLGSGSFNKIAGEDFHEQIMPPATGRATTSPNSTQSDLYSREGDGSGSNSRTSTGTIEMQTPTSYMSPAPGGARTDSFSPSRKFHESESSSGRGGSGNENPRAWTREQSKKTQTYVSPTKGRTPPNSKSPQRDRSVTDDIGTNGEDRNGRSTGNTDTAIENASTKPPQTKNTNFKSLVQQWEKRNGPVPSPANFAGATQAASSRASNFDISSPNRRTTASVAVGAPHREAKTKFHHQSYGESSPISNDHVSGNFRTKRSSSFQTSSDIASRRITQDVSLSMGTPASSFKPVGSASTSSNVSEGNSDVDDNMGAASSKRLDVARMIRQREERKGGTPRNQFDRDSTLHDSDVHRSKQWKTKDYGAMISSRVHKCTPQRYVNVSDQNDSGENHHSLDVEQDATYRSHDETINSPQKRHPKYEMPNDEIWRMKHGPTNSAAGVRKSPSSHATLKTADETLSHDMSDVSGSTSSYAIDNIRVKEMTTGDSTEFVQLEYVYQEDSFGQFNQNGGDSKVQGRNQSVGDPTATTNQDFETNPVSSSPPTAAFQSPSLRKRLSDRFLRRNISSTSSTAKQETPQSPSKRSSKFLRSGPASGGLTNQQSYKQLSSWSFYPPQMIVVGNDVHGQQDTEI